MSVFRRMIAMMLFALLPAMAAGLFHPKRPAWNRPAPGNEVELSAVLQWGPQVLWVDARARNLFELDHIPGAVLLNEDEWESLLDRFLDAWTRDSTVVVYCSSASCDASQGVAARLKSEAQIQNVYVLKGGWETWRAAQNK